MKANRILKMTTLIAGLLLILTIGCKYDVSEPLWYQPHATPPSPSISQITPSEAGAGVNYITIQGENLIVNNNTTSVYFDNTSAEIISISATSITLRRPNLVSDSSSIKVIPHDALTEAIYTPYKVTKVFEKYGGFLTNVPLGIVAVDKSENIYVVETLSKSIYKATPAGENTKVSDATRAPTDAKFGPDGNLYLTENNRAVDKFDLASGTTERWIQLPSGKVVKFCDFSSNGYFFAGGTKSDLVIMPFDLSSTAVSSGVYAADDIQAIRVYDNRVYVASIHYGSLEPTKIYSHQINSDGTVGAQEEVFDMSSINDSAVVTGLTFSADGKMFIATNADEDPIKVVDMAAKTLDTYYKGLLPHYCGGIYWGTGNYLYMISGNSNASLEWLIYRVDMGKTGAPYF